MIEKELLKKKENFIFDGFFSSRRNTSIVRDSVRNILWKLYYSIGANLINFIVSLFISFAVPKFLGLEQYGYWQLYIFYVGFVGFFHFGHADGIYLRYGGKYYDDLDKSLLHSQLVLLFFQEIFVFLGFVIFAITNYIELNQRIIIIITGLNCILLLPRSLLHFILQATGKIREYARNLIFERVLYLVLVVVFLVLGLYKFEYMVIADVTAKFFAIIEIGWLCRDIVIAKGVHLKVAVNEFFKNIYAGSSLLFANFASQMIIGIVRFGIEKNWDIITFGKVSFSLSISNFIISFIYAIGIVIFPIIKRSNQDKLPLVYTTLGTLLSGFMILLLITYYPIQKLLMFWLPEYHEAIEYFSILLPICIYEARGSLLINTYLKALREEKVMLILNIITVLLSIMMTFIVVPLTNSLTLSIFSIVFLVIIKYSLPDYFLQRKMNVNCLKDMVWNIIVTIVFIYCNWYLKYRKGWLIFILVIIMMFLKRRKEYLVKISVLKDLLSGH